MFIKTLKQFQDDAIESGVSLFTHAQRLLNTAQADRDGRTHAINHNGYLLIEAPTGAGKTLIAGNIVERFTRTEDVVWFWFAPFKGVVGQTCSTLREQFAGLRLRELQDDRNPEQTRSGDVFVTTWQAVATRVTDARNVRKTGELNPSIDTLIQELKASGKRIGVVVDEAHHSFHGKTLAADFFHNILSPEYTILVTATPDDQEIEDLKKRLQIAELHRIRVSRRDAVHTGLIKDGVKTASYIVDAGAEKLVDLEKTALRDATAIHQQIKTALRKRSISLTPLLLVQVDSTPHSVERAKKNLLSLGFTEEQIATHTAEEPDENLLSLANDERKEVLIFKMAVALGFDAPRAFALVSMRASRDPDFGVQLVGRILRVDRRLQLLAQQNKLPDILRYGLVFLTDTETQTGISIAGQRINAIQTEYASVSPTTAIVIVGDKAMVQKVDENGQTGLFQQPAPAPPIYTDESSRVREESAPFALDGGFYKPAGELFGYSPDDEEEEASSRTARQAGSSPKGITYHLKPSAPKHFLTQSQGEPTITEEECAKQFTLSARTLLDALKGSTTLTKKTEDLFTEQPELRLQFEQVITKVDPHYASKEATRALMKSSMFDPRELRKALLRKLEATLHEEKMEEADSPKEVEKLLNLILAINPKLLDEAREKALHSCSQVEQAEPLPSSIVSEQYLPPSRHNIYGVHPPDLNGWERPFADMLDADTTERVLWWHRNPPRKPYSVGVLLPNGANFYPDFIIGIHGRPCPDNALLADPKQAFDTYTEAPKSNAEHPKYGKVLILHKDGTQHWMTVRFNEGDPKPILDKPFSIATLGSWKTPIV